MVVMSEGDAVNLVEWFVVVELLNEVDECLFAFSSDDNIDFWVVLE